MNKGVVYAAFGKPYVREANHSWKSVRQQMPHVHSTLYTDEPDEAEAFDNVMNVSTVHHNRLDKIQNISQAPYDRVLFLDSDTHLCGDVSDVFELLDRFDIAMAHAPRRIHYRYPSLEGVPDSFSEFNSGVMAFRNTPAVQEMFTLWARYYGEALETDWLKALKARRGKITLQDQHFLRRALYETNLHIATLPYEYNCRMVPGIVNGEVKVLHGRHQDLALTASRINAQSHKRLFSPSKTSLYTVGARQQVIVPYLAAVAKAVAGRARIRKALRRLRTVLGL